MRIADAQWIPSSPHQTWEALTDPAVLSQCIPGCVQMERRSPIEYVVTLRATVGEIAADYKGEILLSDLDSPHGCILVFEVQQEAAGLVVGTAQIRLSTKDNGTRLSYAVVAMAGGKLGQLGEAMLHKAGKKWWKNSFLTLWITWPRNLASIRRPRRQNPKQAVGDWQIRAGPGPWLPSLY